MESHIAHMYQLHKFMESLSVAARRSSVPKSPLQLANEANRYLAQKRKELAPPVDPNLLAAAERIGLSLPPLANCG